MESNNTGKYVNYNSIYKFLEYIFNNQEEHKNNNKDNGTNKDISTWFGHNKANHTTCLIEDYQISFINKKEDIEEDVMKKNTIQEKFIESKKYDNYKENINDYINDKNKKIKRDNNNKNGQENMKLYPHPSLYGYVNNNNKEKWKVFTLNFISSRNHIFERKINDKKANENKIKITIMLLNKTIKRIQHNKNKIWKQFNSLW